MPVKRRGHRHTGAGRSLGGLLGVAGALLLAACAASQDGRAPAPAPANVVPIDAPTLEGRWAWQESASVFWIYDIRAIGLGKLDLSFLRREIRHQGGIIDTDLDTGRHRETLTLVLTGRTLSGTATAWSTSGYPGQPCYDVRPMGQASGSVGPDANSIVLQVVYDIASPCPRDARGAGTFTFVRTR